MCRRQWLQLYQQQRRLFNANLHGKWQRKRAQKG